MKCLIFIILIAFNTAGSQPFTISDPTLIQCPVSSATPAWSPTNIPGYTCVAWYVADNALTNESGIVTNWPDSFGGYFLTNSSPSKECRLTNSLNGHLVVSINALTNSLSESNSPATGAPYEVAMVIRVDVPGSITPLGALWSPNQTGCTYGGMDCSVAGSNRLFIRRTVTVYDTVLQTNVWKVVSWCVGAPTGRVYTNGELAASGGSGTLYGQGFCLGSYYNGTVPIAFEVAEILRYTTRAPSTNDTVRAQLYNYFTNKYAITP